MPVAVTDLSPNSIRIDASGKIEAEATAAMLDRLFEVVGDRENLGVLAVYSAIRFPSLGAIGSELRRLDELWSLAKRIDRIAIVTDQGWVRKVATVEGKVLPLTVRVFEPGQETAAAAFATRAVAG